MSALPPTADPTDPALALAPRIGVFDSGVGGLSVLRALRSALPRADLHYIADGSHAPYGDRSEEEVRGRSAHIVQLLQAAGADIIVIACNTATAAAAASLRAAQPDLRLVGVEPGIKPARAISRNQRIGVLATTRTLASDKFRALAAAHAGEATLVLQACPGLADAIEQAHEDLGPVAERIARYAAPLREAGVDVAVLGCTHYPFAEALFRAALPGVHLVDTAEAVARQAARLAAELPAARRVGQGRTTLATTGDVEALQGFATRWLGWDTRVGTARQPLG